MGQKVHPTGIRLRITKEWNSTWYVEPKKYADVLYQDRQIRTFLEKELAYAQVSRIKIERAAQNINITIYTARPGVIIGKGGEGIDRLRDQVHKLANAPVHINIEEIRKPEIEASLVAASVAQQLERRIAFRRAMKRAVTAALQAGAQGIKISVSGRLGGAEIARSEWYREGRVPLHTLRADVDYALAQAKTIYGIIGVKVWIFKGEKI